MPQDPLTLQLQAQGLSYIGPGSRLSELGPHWLQNCTLLEGFTPEEADLLGAGLLLMRAQPGQVLLREGERGDWSMLILSGTVDVTKQRVGRDAVAHPGPARVAVIKAGGVLGEMSMLDGEPRFSTCTAIETVECGVLTRSAIARLIREQPAVGAKLLVQLTQLLAHRLRATTTQLMRVLHHQ